MVFSMTGAGVTVVYVVVIGQCSGLVVGGEGWRQEVHHDDSVEKERGRRSVRSGWFGIEG
jgi:hypothetical protein